MTKLDFLLRWRLPINVFHRKVALSTYHRYECKSIDFLIASGMSIICFLALRAVTGRSVRFFRENEDKFRDHDETSGSVKSRLAGKYLSSDYRNLFNLVTHHGERKVGDIFHRALLTIMMIKYHSAVPNIFYQSFTVAVVVVPVAVMFPASYC